MSATAFVIRGARHWQGGAPLELAVADGTIVERAPKGAVVVDAGGAVLAPGLVDTHVHLREPGQAFKETIATGARAAAAGGFTAVCCMPNTDPVLDSAAWIEWVLSRAREAGHCRVHPMGAVTMGQKGEQLTPALALKRAGAVALSDDGRPIMSAAMMRHALEYARHAGLPIVGHEEDLTLRGDGQMNEGFTATRLGIPAIPAAAESVMVRRDVDLAELTGGRVHLAHLSCRASFDALRDARRRGLAVTGETCPHYWTLTDEAVGDYNTHAKMNPPLRTAMDVAALQEGVKDGTIDVIATDHAPHHYDEKEREFADAPNGIVGLETALSVNLTWLVHRGVVDIPTLVEKMACAPARLFKLPGGTLRRGAAADVTVFDADVVWTVDPAKFRSKGRNTPYTGMELRGRVECTLVDGRIVYRRGA